MNLIKPLAFLLALNFLAAFPCLAQNEFASLATKERFVYEPCGYASQDGTFTLFYYHKETRSFYTFNNKGEVISEILAPYPSQLLQEKPLGIHETKEAYHYYFQSSTHHKSLEVISLGKHKASQAFSLLPLTTNRQEKFLQTLSLKGKLYFLLMNRRNNTLIVLRPAKGNKLERFEFSVTKAVLRNIRKEDYTSVSGDREIPFSSLETTKAYLPEENKLVLIKELDPRRGSRESGLTGILELNLQTEEANYRLLFGPDNVKKQYQSNTLLHEDKLIKVSSNKNFFSLAFHSYPALEKQKEFFYNDTTAIALIQRRLQRRKGDNAPEYIERQEVKKILRSLNKGTLAVNARSPEEAVLQLQIGSFGFIQSGGAPRMTSMGGGTISTPGGTVSLPVSYGFYSTPGRSQTFSNTFETSFSGSSLEPGGSGTLSLEEKEQTLIESLEVRKSDRILQLPVSFRKNLVAHYNNRERVFTFYLLSQGDLYKAYGNTSESPNGF